MPIRRVFFDIDGVLARFTCGALAVHGRPEHSGQWRTWDFPHTWGIGERAFYAPMGREFWSSLGRWEDGFALLRYCETAIGAHRIALLTTPAPTEGCVDGKRDWVAAHLPEYLPRLILGWSKELLAHECALLVDDSDANVNRFRYCDGHAWTVPRPWNHNRGRVGSDGTFNVLTETRRIEQALNTK
jgi:hypothetical protein